MLPKSQSNNSFKTDSPKSLTPILKSTERLSSPRIENGHFSDTNPKTRGPVKLHWTEDTNFNEKDQDSSSYNYSTKKKESGYNIVANEEVDTILVEGKQNRLEEVFFSILIACLFITMDVLIHQQLSQEYSPLLLLQNICKVLPGMFIVGTFCGCYFIRIILEQPTVENMKVAPSVITALVYCLVQLDLVAVGASLVMCASYYVFEANYRRY
ncbi:hypothetical protein BGZ76_011429 [Entomortierella beljakovae]|nr:hypothetical protein BGZ76_011429 [Entomortierella beljakovae]